ncbi:hypothetical protein BsWGS_28245 [Bradybaena similaris]
MSLSGKVAIVTGAAQGLGKAFCEILLQNGAKVALTDMNSDQGLKTLSEFQTKYGQNKVMFIKCDVTSQAEMSETFETVRETFGGLDIIINNAGVGIEMGELWEKTVDVNVKGTIRGTMLGIEHLRRDKGGNGGVIVNISSMAGINPYPCGPIYGATKSAIIMYSQALAKNPELAANGVRINVLAPAFADTALVVKVKDCAADHLPAVFEQIMARVGMMTPEYVAEALIELVDDQKKNGAILKIAKATGKEYHIL